MGGITLPHLLIIAVLVVLLFGTKKLRSLGSDLGSSIKGFKKAMSDEDDKEKEKEKANAEDADFNAKLADKQHTEVKKEDVKNDKV
ncbi:twin-arginine translocase TatA/TatE family subunit [Erwinia pyrifoliae]|uniref:Sec-independent protein translocase protein TatA n=1 Tax=Erwinia pyrifoliae TaxID=79967 RepID=A0ABY5X904_ERWPY|nr:twin-arginine translocase TatA/TatE family subunit [Erwinia pyrifoliae]AUX74156.1 twin-arginine translocase TatA/TatE family subunit [Erwinia pyrifoliae]MCA8875495.1 twin-arginine translocase TatA/TatE family subunit [Erwinia pyrifoliae]MCT2385213.1 twin-arginine translocase TatA/TatE family subunit [Erwinia pyrifoliae]MCU8585563.1 twin-arginine translocase TatA/TatE family subunit [Erwinia pyrifoliae]UWS33866.1 twin-arginine translocase TatA/TatE family subunit [Erwinia pyrifoliae]